MGNSLEPITDKNYWNHQKVMNLRPTAKLLLAYVIFVLPQSRKDGLIILEDMATWTGIPAYECRAWLQQFRQQNLLPSGIIWDGENG